MRSDPEENVLRAIDDVIEEHRVRIGADKVHVTLGSNPTPEGVEQELIKLEEKSKIYASFTREEQLNAQIFRLRAVLRNVAKKCHRQLHEETVPVSRLLEIFSLVDLVPDVALEQDIEWMTNNRDICLLCGKPSNNHNYRHLFKSSKK